MFYRSMLVALLGAFLGGCAVYGGGYDHGYGYRGHDRYYSSSHYQVQRYPVYVAPRYYGYDDRRYDRRRYDGHRHDQRRYLPAPSSRQFHHDRRDDRRFDRRSDRRHDMRHDQRRRDYRAEQPRKGWGGQHFKLQERTPKHQRHDKGSRGDDRRGWESRHN